jgi:Zn-finger nucleic acid-binding protein
MTRVHFARASGVIVDVCKGHGTWFDRDELRQVLEFVRAGGLDVARAREKEELEHERQRLKDRQRALAEDGALTLEPDTTESAASVLLRLLRAR